MEYLITTEFSTNFVSLYLSVWASQVAVGVKSLPPSAGDAGDLGLTPGLGRSPRGGHGNPLQYTCLGNPMGRAAWWAIVRGVAESQA